MAGDSIQTTLVHNDKIGVLTESFPAVYQNLQFSKPKSDAKQAETERRKSFLKYTISKAR